MEPVIMDGKALSEKLRAEMIVDVRRVVEKTGTTPVLATILVGDDPSSHTYVRMKGRACDTIGLASRRIDLPSSSSTADLLAAIDQCNSDSSVYGILLQHPVPKQIDERVCFDRILPEKDVDGVTTLGFGRLSFGLPAFASCTPGGIIRLIDEYTIPLSGKRAAVVGRSPILGKPMAMMLLERDCTVTICHSKTSDLPATLADADIVVAALGRAEFIRGEWLKEGVVVIDAGYNPGNVGDAHYESCLRKASYITPVPGGVGPMTITMLLANTVEAALRRNSLMN
jgi:methylenetetrahydrofolate dehydrogenase (NADP+)/methenyltetrahydrofolate cyclohydrolase